MHGSGKIACVLMAVGVMGVLCGASQAGAISFLDFSDVSAWTINGNASQQGNRLQITPNVGSQAGSAFHTSPISFESDYTFAAHFTYEMPAVGGGSDVDGQGADGLTFVIQSDDDGPILLGGAGGALGLTGGNNSGPFVAVELDTWHGGSFDPPSNNNFNGNHLGIDASTAGTSIAQTAMVPRFQEAGVIDVWVDYDGSSDTMVVYESRTGGPKPATALVRGTIDLESIFSTSDLYVGFTGGTGGATTQQDVLSLQLDSSAGVVSPSPLPAGGPTVQNFDDPGTPYVSVQTDAAPGPTIMPGGPAGNFIRMVNDGTNNNKNAIAFDQTGDGFNPSGAVVMDFDVRILSNTGDPADGAAFMLTPTSLYGASGQGAYDGSWAAEEPNRPGVFAVGIDLHPAGSINDVSVHWDGTELANVTMDNADLDWDAGVFHHVHAELVEGAGAGDVAVRVTLTPDIHGTPGTPFTPIEVAIPGLKSLYDYRVEFAARTGGLNFDFDADNISVRAADPSELAPFPRFDVTRPGDTVVGFNAAGPGADWPGGEAPLMAIDDDTGTKYLNFGTTGNGGGSGTGGPTGFAVAPDSGLSVVTGLTFTSANDAPPRDPVDFILAGSNDGGATFTEIATGSIPAFTSRFETVAVDFPNDQRYGNYMLTFPNVADPSSANSMQIAEVEFLSDDVLADVTRPGDSIVASSGNSPTNEGVANAIDDDPNTKYLNFDEQNTGFTVTPSMGATIVEGLGLRSANDAVDRDPAEFLLEGSDDGTTFELIAQGLVPAFPGRFSELNFGFDNDVPYLHYRLTFPDVQNPAGANSMQIGEVQLFGAPVSTQAIPEPSTWLLLGLGGIGMLLWRRRRMGA